MPDYSKLYSLANAIKGVKDEKKTDTLSTDYSKNISNREIIDALKTQPGSQTPIEAAQVYTPPIDVGALSQRSMFVPAQSTTSGNITQGMDFSSQNTQTGSQAPKYKSIPAPAIKPAAVEQPAVEQPKALSAPVVASTASALPKTDKKNDKMDLSWLVNLLGVAEAGGKGYLGDKTPGYLQRKETAETEKNNRLAEIIENAKQQMALENAKSKNAAKMKFDWTEY